MYLQINILATEDWILELCQALYKLTVLTVQIQ